VASTFTAALFITGNGLVTEHQKTSDIRTKSLWKALSAFISDIQSFAAAWPEGLAAHRMVGTLMRSRGTLEIRSATS